MVDPAQEVMPEGMYAFLSFASALRMGWKGVSSHQRYGLVGEEPAADRGMGSKGHVYHLLVHQLVNQDLDLSNIIAWGSTHHQQKEPVHKSSL